MVERTLVMNETPDDPEEEEGTSEIEEEIAILTTLISQARDLVAKGQTIDLTNLSGKVSEFCAGVTANPPSDADGAKVMVNTVIQDLNNLAQEINDQQQTLAGEPEKKGNGS